MTREELIEEFKSSNKNITDYMKLKMVKIGTKDEYSCLSSDQLVSLCNLSIEDKEYLNQLFKYNPILKFREDEILRWLLRGLTLEESVIRAQVFLYLTIKKIGKSS